MCVSIFISTFIVKIQIVKNLIFFTCCSSQFCFNYCIVSTHFKPPRQCWSAFFIFINFLPIVPSNNVSSKSWLQFFYVHYFFWQPFLISHLVDFWLKTSFAENHLAIIFTDIEINKKPECSAFYVLNFMFLLHFI